MSDSHEPQGFISKYVFSFDHKVIGIQYLITAALMGIVGGGLAIYFRTHLATPGSQLVEPEQYISLVTMHGTIMIFFVISPALIGGFGNFLIPLMVGARDMAYPLLNMLSYWTIVPASLLMLASFFVPGGAAAAGWTSYPPLSALSSAVPGSGMGQDLWLMSMALFIVSFTMGGFNYLSTILNMRTKGMSMMRMPMAIWTYLISTILGLLSFPALTAAAVMLLLDRMAGTSFFLPDGLVVSGKLMEHSGGTPLLFQHLFWFLGHPEVYVLVLPAVGIAFDILPTFARRPIFGYKPSVYAMLLVAFLSMIVWGHHMFTSGMNPYVGEYFSIVTVMITVPFAVLAVSLIASLYKARIRTEIPMMFVLGLISAIGIGGLGGIYLGTQTTDIYFHDSYFVVGHFHLMIGVVTLLGTFGGLYYWFPKMFGRFMNDLLGRVHFWLTIVPMFTIFILMHVQGLGGMARRYYDNIYEFTDPVTSMFGIPMPWIITTSAYLMGLGSLLFLGNFFYSMFKGQKSPENPWDAATLEWTTPSPAPHGNWPGEIPEVHRGPYEYYETEDGAGVLRQSDPPGPTPGTEPEPSGAPS